MNTIIELAEDHFAGCSLEHAGDRDIDCLRDHPARVIDHHHRTVIQVSDSLIVFLALFKDKDAHRFAGEYNRLQRIRELVDVENLNAPQLGHLIEVEVIGHDLAAVDLSEFDELKIDFANLGEVIFDDADFEVRDLLDALQDVETTATAIALQPGSVEPR